MARSSLPAFLLPGAPPSFPDPRLCSADGLVAVGGDLLPERLIAAYEAGIFPCYGSDSVPLWWSPDPRAVFTPSSFHASRRLLRRLRRGEFEFTFERAFRDVMIECDRGRRGTWILPEIIDAYVQLHERGRAHSVEVWSKAGDLVGGFYGVRCGAVFAAESMFHRATDSSKAALAVGTAALFRAGFEVIDVQYPTEHLTSLGVEVWPRARYLERLAELRERNVDLSQVAAFLRGNPATP